MTWPERIERLARAYGSREALARALGVSTSTVFRWLKGQEPRQRIVLLAVDGLEASRARCSCGDLTEFEAETGVEVRCRRCNP